MDNAPPTQQRITWIYQRFKEQSLDLAPPFQRKPVWSLRNKSYLIDTIINGLPIPEIYMQIKTDKDGKTKYVIIDGQQRIRAILEFLDGEFEIDENDNREFGGKEFSELPDDIRKNIWDYSLVIREIKTDKDIEVRGIFQRLNKNVVPLNRQELRNAAYIGQFITLMNELSADDFWSANKIVSPSDIRRMIDAEFISELFIAMMHGIQQRDQDSIDGFYKQYDDEFPNKDEWNKKYRRTIDIIQDIIPHIESTRWHRKVDFYSLFLSVQALLEEYIFPAERYGDILNALDEFEKQLSEDESQLEGIAKVYNEATWHTTVKEDRIKRSNVIREILIPFLIAKDSKRNFNDEERRIAWNLNKDKKCSFCGKIIEWKDYELDHKLPHSKGGKTELSNSQIMHSACNKAKSNRK